MGWMGGCKNAKRVDVLIMGRKAVRATAPKVPEFRDAATFSIVMKASRWTRGQVHDLEITRR